MLKKYIQFLSPLEDRKPYPLPDPESSSTQSKEVGNHALCGIGENGQFRDMKQDIFFAATKRLGADSLWRCCGVHGSLTSVTLLSSG